MANQLFNPRDAEIIEAKRRILALVPDEGFIPLEVLFDTLDTTEPLLMMQMIRSAFTQLLEDGEVFKDSRGVYRP